MARSFNRRLGNYELLKLISHGGFADIYLAQHIYLKRYVAIKVMRIQSPQGRRAFLREAQIMTFLKHRLIVRILDFGIEEGTPFIVMNYFPRGSLRLRHPRGEKLSLNVILRYLRHIVEALEYTHRRGYIHQDIKPDNMLVGPKNEVVLCDFGIAVALNEAYSQDLGEIVGTASYMAPERFEGIACAASDQYALGIVIFEWLTGELPFDGSLGEIVWQHLNAVPPSLRTKRPEISPSVEQAILKALEKDPMSRFESIRDFVAALEQACNISHPLTAVSPQILRAGTRKQKALFFVCGVLIFSIPCFILYMLGTMTGIAVLVSSLSFLLLAIWFWNASRRE